MEKMENLIGPKPEDVVEKEIDGVTADGQPIWHAFLEDSDAPSLSPDEVQMAKNAAMNADQETISMCQRISFAECKEEVQKKMAA